MLKEFWTKIDEYYLTEHDEEEVKKRMKEREVKLELQARFEALSPCVKTYLSLTQSLQAPDLPRPARGILEERQQEELKIISLKPELRAELGNYLNFKNQNLKPQNGA